MRRIQTTRNQSNLTMIRRPWLLNSSFMVLLTIAGCSQDSDLAVQGAPGNDLSKSLSGVSCEYQFIPFDAPSEMGNGTSAFGVNNRGVIVGNYFTVDERIDGFVYKNGQFIDVWVAGSTSLLAVNDLGDATGSFDDSEGIVHTFLRNRNGDITVLPDPAPDAVITEAVGINNRGNAVGFYFDPDFVVHGFTYSNGFMTVYDYPGSGGTFLTGINNHEQVTGFWVDPDGIRHGFLLDHGTPQPIDFPGALHTRPRSINDRGQVIGYYSDSNNISHGFILDAGVFTSLDFPGSMNTNLFGINNGGTIVGTYDDYTRGLVAKCGGSGDSDAIERSANVITSQRVTLRDELLKQRRLLRE